MGMKQITLPAPLIELPQPWAMTRVMERHKQLERLSYRASEIQTALNVLSRCLCTLSHLSQPPVDAIGQSLMGYWGFTAEWLAREMPTLDELRLYKIDRKLKEYEIESSSEETFQLASYWLWWQVLDLADTTLNWLEDALMETQTPNLISDFLRLASRYWQQVEPDLAQSLLISSAMIGQRKALPLLKNVELSPSASSSVRETARDYRQLIVDSNQTAKAASATNMKLLNLEADAAQSEKIHQRASLPATPLVSPSFAFP